MSVEVKIDEERCKGCGLCISVCPKKVLEMNNVKSNGSDYFPAKYVGEGCSGCGKCYIVCGDSAITVEERIKN